MIDKPVEQRDLAWAAYQKPPLMLTLLRDAVLDSATFNRAFRDYIRRWAFKHPQPADFFRTMANVSGRDLDWFWRDCGFTTPRLHPAVDSVIATKATADVYPSNPRPMVMPATP